MHQRRSSSLPPHVGFVFEWIQKIYPELEPCCTDRGGDVIRPEKQIARPSTSPTTSPPALPCSTTEGRKRSLSMK